MKYKFVTYIIYQDYIKTKAYINEKEIVKVCITDIEVQYKVTTLTLGVMAQ